MACVKLLHVFECTDTHGLPSALITVDVRSAYCHCHCRCIHWHWWAAGRPRRVSKEKILDTGMSARYASHTSQVLSAPLQRR
jgi:hypothetical protein